MQHHAAWLCAGPRAAAGGATPHAVLGSQLAGRDPRASLIERLIAEGREPLDVLFQLAAVHEGRSRDRSGFRTTFVGAGERAFPHVVDVPPLTLFLLQRLTLVWRQCTSMADDLYVAAFAIYGLLAIHPFANGNGRTAIDFAQYSLMCRWGRSVVPLAVPPDAHRILGQVLRPLDEDFPLDNDGFAERCRFLAQRIDHSDLSSLRHTAAFVAVVAWLNAHIDRRPTRARSDP